MPTELFGGSGVGERLINNREATGPPTSVNNERITDKYTVCIFICIMQNGRSTVVLQY